MSILSDETREFVLNAGRHQSKTHAIAVDCFKELAKQTGVKAVKLKKRFIKHDVLVTEAFWRVLWSKHPNSGYNCIDYCDCCGKFTLSAED